MRGLIVELLPASLSGDRRDQLLYVLAFLALAAGTLLCLLALRVAALDVLAVAVAAAGGAAWVLSNNPGEGDTLLVVLPGNGLTLADTAVLPAVFLVAYLGVRRWRTR